jgi:hypothetical protein
MLNFSLSRVMIISTWYLRVTIDDDYAWLYLTWYYVKLLSQRCSLFMFIFMHEPVYELYINIMYLYIFVYIEYIVSNCGDVIDDPSSYFEIHLVIVILAIMALSLAREKLDIETCQVLLRISRILISISLLRMQISSFSRASSGRSVALKNRAEWQTISGY